MAFAYYNEHDPIAAQWLRNLIAERLIAAGDVDERSIEDVRPVELAGYTQCHFFAGIGGWSVALRLAGWPDDRHVWTGSCPCQPFSAAGKGGGFADERHLWPHFHWLIGQCAPAVVFGEQVASKDGLNWFDLVRSDLEAEGYAVGAADLCAAGFGAPHIRQRLYWVADAEQHGGGCEAAPADPGQPQALGPADQHGGHRGASVRRLADCAIGGRGEERSDVGRRPVGDSAQGLAAGSGAGGSDHRPGPTNAHWAVADWLACRDGKWRPVEPGTFPLAHGVHGRVGLLRGYGNAIVPQVAAAFIDASGLISTPEGRALE